MLLVAYKHGISQMLNKVNAEDMKAKKDHPQQEEPSYIHEIYNG